MPSLTHAPLALQIKTDAQTAAARNGVYSPAAMPSITAEFARFRANEHRLTFANAARLGKVSDRSEFSRLRQYLDNAYDGVTVIKTIQVDGQTYDCIPAEQQPARRRGGSVDTPPDGAMPGIQPNSLAGRVGACAGGTVPFARLELGDLIRYPTLRAFLRKGKQGIAHETRDGGPFTPGGAHHYAVVRTYPGGTNCAGADVNIWSAPVYAGYDQYRMSLSQIWLTGRSRSGYTQSLKVGWNVQPLAWRTPKAVPFIYSTQDGYNQTGCYNLECSDFVQTSSSVIFGSAFASSSYSVPGGTQPVMSVEWHRGTSTGNWWLSVNDRWVGYYPRTLYTGGNLASANQSLVFDAGGEIAEPDGGPTLPMGSGKFAATGYRHAAFIANMFYLDGRMQSYYSNLPKAQLLVGDPRCYTLALAGVSSSGFPNGVSTIAKNPQMDGTSFYMGGPGCTR